MSFQFFRFFQTELAESGLPLNTVAVVSLAGQNVLDPTRRWTPGFKQNVWASRVNTTQSLAHAVIRAPFKPKVFISISGVGKTVRSLTGKFNGLLLTVRENNLHSKCKKLSGKRTYGSVLLIPKP
jgi:NAD dependent epimerase/dehydratase family enzyme